MLENQSLRTVFVMVLLLAFALGMDVALTAYQCIRLHRFSALLALNMLSVGILAFRYSRAIYRRLDREGPASTTLSTHP
jgi:hypothetical protein